jgi:hypothetical protein
MKFLVLASLALATATSSGTAFARRLPTPPPPAPMPPSPGMHGNVCRASGTPLFEIRHRSEVKAPTSTISVYSTGAWVFRPVDENGRPGRVARGCLDRSDLRAIRSAIRIADWDVTRMQIRCFAYAPSYTEYVVRGKVVFHDQLCSGYVLDENSRASLDTIRSALPMH